MSKSVLLAATVAAVIGGASSADAACAKMDKVTAAWLPIMQTTAYYVAIEQKLFEKACIELDSNKMESPNQIIDALIAERADFGPPGTAAGIAMIAESKFPGKLLPTSAARRSATCRASSGGRSRDTWCGPPASIPTRT